jgi:hypothetical protein
MKMSYSSKIASTRYRFLLPFSLWIALFGLFLVQCEEEEEEEKVEVGGEKLTCESLAVNLVNGSLTKEHPEVGLIVITEGNGNAGTCTGTFVSANTMITAAHCIDNTENGNAYYVPGIRPSLSDGSATFIKAEKVFHLDKTSEDFASQSQSAFDEIIYKDIAVLVFPDVTAPAVAGIAATNPQADEEVTLVGYGATKTVDIMTAADSDNGRRMGQSLIADSMPATPDDDRLIFIGGFTSEESEAVLGEKSLVSKGDSGGPILHDGKLAGVLSSASVTAEDPPKYYGIYNSLLSAEVQELFDRARAGGAVIPEPGEETVPAELASYAENCL